MSIRQDAQVTANVSVGGTDRSALYYDSVTHLWRTKNQAGTDSALITGVNTVSAADSTLTISPTSGSVLASRAAITGDIGISAGSNTSAIGSNKVLNSMLAQMANLTVKGNVSGGTANASDLTQAQVTALINTATTSVPGAMSASDKSRADNWYNKAFYNVLDNGISSANSGAANVTAWNALMTVLANSAATVYFPPASAAYDFASVCAIPAGVHLRVMGAGPSTRTSESFGVLIRTTSATADIFSCGDWYQEFVNLTFRSSVTRSGGAAIAGGNNVSIQAINCNFNSMYNGIDLSGGAQSGNLALIDDCHFTDTVNFSIKIDGTNCNAIIRATTADCAPASVAHLEVNACGSLLVSDCDFIRATNNVRLNPDSGTKGVFSVYFTNTFFDTAAGSAIKFMGGAAGTNIQRVKFVNCWFSGSVNGCEFAAVTSTNKATAIDFVNCDIYSNSANGILATEVQDFALNNCRIAGNSTAGVNTLATAGSVTKFDIQNCRIGPTAGIGANGIGINIQAGTYGGYNISGNDVGGNTSSNNITDSGSVATTDLKVIVDNLGHLVQGIIASQGATPLSVPITTETLVLSARIPPNSVSVGQVFRVRCIGVMSAANAVTWKLRVGTAGTAADTPIVWTAILGAVGAANCRHGCEVLLTVRSIGGAGTVQAEGLQHHATATVTTFDSTVVAVAAAQTIATNAAWFIDITLTQTIGTSLIQQAVIEAL